MQPRTLILAVSASLLALQTPCTALPLATAAATPLHALDAPTRELTRVYLARLSLSPEAACAAGLTAQHVATLFQTASDTLESLTPSIEASDLAVKSARAELAALRARAANQLDPALSPILTQAESALTTALATQAQLWQGAFETTIAPLSDAQKTQLRSLRANARQDAPIEYRVVTMTTDEWASLNDALHHVRSREACNLQPSPAKAAVVAVASANATVYAAKQRLQTDLANVRTAWNAPEQP